MRFPSKPRIAFFPAGGETLPTARIRHYSLGHGMAELGLSWSIGDEEEKADILLIETWELKILPIVRRAKARGAIILFDRNNAEVVAGRHPVMLELMRLADVVTTSTDALKEWIEKEYALPRVDVFRDPIDYYPKAPSPSRAEEKGPLRLLWFGSLGNASSLEKYLPALEKLENLKMVVVAAIEDSDRLARYSFIESHVWDLETFVSVLQSCHLSIMMHDTNRLDASTKTSHKMVTSIVWGVPSIATRTQDYERTARELSVEEGLFSTPEELVSAIEKLRPEAARKNYLERSQKTAWARYSPKTIAEAVVSIARRAGESRGDAPRPPAPDPIGGFLNTLRDFGALVAWKLGL